MTSRFSSTAVAAHRVSQVAPHEFEIIASPDQLVAFDSVEAMADWLVGFGAVSFDIFDTLLTRRGLFQPHDAFLSLGEILQERIGLDPSVFAVLRRRAERLARNAAEGRGEREIRIEQIYENLNKLLPTLGRGQFSDGELNDLVQIESDLERDYLIPVPSVVSLYRALQARRARIVLVSDFYIGANYLAGILESHGLHGYERLFVSCDELSSKHDGSLFKRVCKELGLGPRELFHIGDNPWPDISRAAQSGVIAARTHNPTTRMIRYHKLGWDRFHGGLTSAMLARQSEDLFGRGGQRTGPEEIETLMRVGRECLGPLLLGLASWLYDEAEKCRYSTLHFCSRDGLIMKRAFDLYQQRFGHRAKSTYLCVSRQVLYRAQAAADKERAQELFAQNWSQLTPAEALARWGLDPDEHGEAILAAGFASPAEVVLIGDRRGEAKLKSLFRAMADPLRAANSAHAERLIAYLAQNGLTQGKGQCVVDIGWHGSLQRALQALGDGALAGLSGRYLGLFIGKAAAEIGAAGYLFTHDKTPRSDIVRRSPSLVELLHTAGHGSTSGYRLTDGQLIEPIFERRPGEEVQYAQRIEPIQREALAFVKDVLDSHRQRPETIPPEVAMGGLARLLTRPFPDEIQQIGSLEIAANYGETANTIKLTQRSPEGYALWRV